MERKTETDNFKTNYSDEQIEFTYIISNIMLDFMQTLQTISADKDFSNGRLNIMNRLHKMKPMDGFLYSGAICPNCKSKIKSDCSLSTYAFAMSVVFLLQKRMITSKKIVLPTEKQIARTLFKKGIGAEFSLRCTKCDFQDHYIRKLDPNEMQRQVA